MRTIKFRGKRIDNSEWVVGDLFNATKIVVTTTSNKGIYTENGSHTFKYEYIEITPETVGQFTGLFDRDGKEIFEGDIIMVRKYNNSKGVVVFLDGTFMIEYKYIKREFSEYALVAFEVIGNIYDNPDLLNQ